MPNLIPAGSGSIITDALSTWGTTANAFDGNTNQSEANSAAANAHGGAPIGTNYIGKDWGGATHKVTQIILYGPNNNGLLRGGGGGVTWTFDGWNGSSWVQLDTGTTSGASSEVITRTASGSGSGSQSITATTAYSKHRIAAAGNNTNGCAIAEFQLYEDNNSYTLTCAAGSFSVTGNAAIVKKAIRLTAAAGSFVMTGVAAILHKNKFLVAAAGAFTVTGRSAILARFVAPASKTALRRARFVLQKLRIIPPTLSD